MNHTHNALFMKVSCVCVCVPVGTVCLMFITFKRMWHIKWHMMANKQIYSSNTGLHTFQPMQFGCIDLFISWGFNKDTSTSEEEMKNCECVEFVSVYLVVCPDVPGENSQVVKTKWHVIVYILAQPLVGGAGVTMEIHTNSKAAFRLTFVPI